MLRFFVLPTDNTRISGSYDSLNRSSSASAYQGVSNGVSALGSRHQRANG
jgi:hypothetical protein